VPQGEWDPAFAPVAEELDRVVAADGQGGGAVAVYHRGRKVVDVWAGSRDAAGTPWDPDTLAVSFSTTKGVTSTALHLCVDRGLIDYDDRVAKHWPEFAANGKEAITVRQVLCHEAGLYDFTAIASRPEDALDWDRMMRGIEQMRPAYEPGTENAYHAVTFGWLVGELVQRVSGMKFSEFIEQELASALDLDGCYIGLPSSEATRVAELISPDYSATLDRDPDEFVALAASMGFTVHPEIIRRALPPFIVEGGALDPVSAPVPAGNGCFTARSLARLYAALAGGGEIDGIRLLGEETIRRAGEVQNTRPDLVLAFPMQWRLGYHGVFTAAGVIDTAFGHNGLGGSGAWADPARDLSVGYTLNALGSLITGDLRFITIGGAAVTCADAVGVA
jgi:CubicO group peptidase (beta-lactamase class C family)